VSDASGRLLAERLQTALDLYEAGEELMRENLRRQHPEADEVEIEHLLAAWLHERPGAEHGDAPGRVIHWLRGT
jgi:Rv0078B-related antitoxin